MKRKLSLLIVLIMLLQMLPLQIFADEVLTLNVGYDKDAYGETLKAGDEFALEFKFENNPGIASFAVIVDFPKDVLSIVPFEDEDESTHYISYNTTKLTNTFFISDDGSVYGSDGKIKVGFVRLANAKGDFQFASITFKVLESAKPDDYNITLSVSDADVMYVMDEEQKELAYAYNTTVPFTVKGEEFADTMSLAGAGTYTYGDTMNVGVTGAPTDAKITYTVNSDEVAAADLANTIKDVGTYTISAKVEKDGYNPKNFAAITVIVNPKEVTVTANDVTRPYNGTATASSNGATASGIADSDTLSFQLGEITLPSADVGTYTVNGVAITWTGDEAVKANYNLPTKAQVKVTVTRKAVTVTPYPQSKLLGADDPALTYLADGLIGTETLTGELTRATGNIVGTYEILQGTLTNENNPNYDIDFKTGVKLTITDKEYTRIEIATNPTKIEYKQDQTLDITGMVLWAYYTDPADGSEKFDEITDTDTNITYVPAEFKTIGDSIPVTISYFDQTATLNVKVTAKVLTGFQVVNNKSQYIEDEDFEPDITVYPVYDNGIAPTEYEPLTTTEYEVIAPATLTVRDKTTIKVQLKNNNAIQATYDIKVVAKTLTGLTVKTNPNKTDYYTGQTFDPNGAAFTATYNNGKSYDVNWGDAGLTHDKTTALTTSDTTVTFTYTVNGVSKTATVTLTITQKAVASIEVTDYEDSYIEGQSFDKDSVVLKLTYNDGDVTENVKPGNTLLVSKDPLTDGNYDITLTYAGCTDTVAVTVAAKQLQSIAVDADHSKTTYVDGEAFDKTNTIVYAYYDNFPETPVRVTDFDADVPTVVETTTSVTISLYGKTATLPITVKPCVAIVVDGSSNETRYASFEDAVNAAGKGDTVRVVKDTTIEKNINITDDVTVVIEEGASLTQSEGTKITVSGGTMTIENENTDASVDLTINDEKVTIEAGGTTTVEPVKEDDFGAYYTFYLQMLQWRNRTFIVSYKQTEGGTISGANTARFSQSVTFTVTPDDGYAIADVLVNGKSVGAVDSYTIRSIKANTTVSATFEKLETETVEMEIVPETAPWANPFTDVGEMDAFYVAVQYVYENGLFKGMSDTEFGPAITMNRAMFVTVLGRLTGVNVDDFTTVTFADCEAGSWYAPYVEWAAKSGIVNGMSATEFAPNAEITVEQALTILYRYMITMGYDLTGAADLTAYADAASVSDWAAPAVQWAVANGIYEAADALAPQSAAARSLVATLLYNLSGMLAK